MTTPDQTEDTGPMWRVTLAALFVVFVSGLIVLAKLYVDGRP